MPSFPGIFHPTPVGDYTPDWAISFREGVVKHIYFVAETKGSMSSLELRAVEHTKSNAPASFSLKSTAGSTRTG